MPKTPLPRKAKRQSRSQRWSVTYMKDLLNESGVKYTPRKTLPVRIRDRKSGHKCQIAKKVRSNKFEFEDFAAAAKEFSFTNI